MERSDASMEKIDRAILAVAGEFAVVAPIMLDRPRFAAV
jgi:hypothetical protein